jgi:hypothetical protein
VAESLSSNLVSDDTLRAWLNGAEENIESGVATDMVAVCPLALRRACRELIERRSRVETGDDEAHALAVEFDRLLDNTLVPNEPLEVYSSNSYRRVGLKSTYREVLYATKDRSDGHPNFSNYAVLDALVCAFNAMLARRAVKTSAPPEDPHDGLIVELNP